MELLSQLFKSDFMPHGMCYLWQPGLLWLHVASDAFIFLAYTSIPVTLVYILKQRKDLIFSKVMVLFGAFVLLCGFTHAISIWNVWNGTYWFSGSVKGVTAAVSIATAIMLWRLVPLLRSIPTVESLSTEVQIRKDLTTELLTQKDKLTEQSDRLTASNDELKAFAYAASHDLKSPLRGIKQLSNWIKEDLAALQIDLPSDTSDHFNLMSSRIQRMEKLLEDLLAYSEAGKTAGEIETVETYSLCNELFDLLVSRDTKIQLVCSDALPKFKTHQAPFAQVLRNLMDNAIKHHEREQGFIWVDAEDLGSVYRFSLEDDGPGIPAEHFERVLEVFTTLKPKDEREGSGLGLAIINKIVAKYHGQLELSQSKKGGLKVSFTWPKNVLTL